MIQFFRLAAVIFFPLRFAAKFMVNACLLIYLYDSLVFDLWKYLTFYSCKPVVALLDNNLDWRATLCGSSHGLAAVIFFPLRFAAKFMVNTCLLIYTVLFIRPIFSTVHYDVNKKVPLFVVVILWNGVIEPGPTNIKTLNLFLAWPIFTITPLPRSSRSKTVSHVNKLHLGENFERKLYL